MASDTDAKALGEALRSEYSAIFGYGVVSAYVSDTYNSSVATVWSAHRARRDRIIHIIESSDEDLPQPEVAYTSTKKVWDSLTAMQLAARIEDDCSIAWVNALQQCSTPDGRQLAMRALLHTAEWTARWRIAAVLHLVSMHFPGCIVRRVKTFTRWIRGHSLRRHYRLFHLTRQLRHRRMIGRYSVHHHRLL